MFGFFVDDVVVNVGCFSQSTNFVLLLRYFFGNFQINLYKKLENFREIYKWIFEN